MKKIIIAFEGLHFPRGAFEFVRRLNQISPVLLTGVFVPQVELSSAWSYAGGISGPLFIPLVGPDETRIIQSNLNDFERLCIANGIDFRIHKDFYDFALPELRTESRFADLLVLGSRSLYEKDSATLPDDYLENIAHNVECPVLVVPDELNFPERVILAYDGSGSSVFAIKQFAYLLPELSRKETILVYIDRDGNSDFPDKFRIEELAARHFPDLSFTKLRLQAKKYFSSWLMEKQDALLVSGSFGRSGFSTLFKKSFVKEVIRDHQMPVFVAHR